MSPNITNEQSAMKVYVCVTLYHVYVTLVKVYSDKEDISKIVILLNANNEKVYQQYIYIGQQLLKHGFVCDVRLRTKWDELRGKVRVQNKQQLLIVEEQMRKIGVSEFTLYNFAWNNSYVYSTASLLYKKCKEAIFIEESTLIAKVPLEKKWKKSVHKIFNGGVDFINDDKLKTIYVQKPEMFPSIWQNKLTILQLDSWTSQLTSENKSEILKIMSQDGERIHALLKEENVGIVYSNPFSEDGLITEKEKITNLMKICSFYKQYGKVILKLHPRDTSKYPIDSEMTLLPGSFPSELLSLTGYKFKYAVAVSSSAVNTTNAEYKINMNENYLHDRKFVLRDINGKIVEKNDDEC